jgi:1-acyl-sn-glycerol-3-phosphate acyltransferase
MLFIFSIIYTFLEYIYQSIFYKNLSTKEYINRLFILNKYLFNWSIDVEEEYHINGDRVLALFTHPKILDGFFALKYITDKYPEHKIIFVVKKELVNLKLVGNYIRDNYLCLERKLEKDEPYIREKIRYFMNKYPKIVIVIFPEGTTFCKETVDKSNEWCDKNRINHFNNLLCPRMSGVRIIIEILKPNVITNNIIYYMDDLYKNKTNYEKDLLKMDIINSCKIISKNIPIRDEFNIYKIWRDNDILLEEEYKKLDLIYQCVNKYYFLNKNIILKNQLMFQTAKLFLLFIPFALYINGLFYSLNIFIVFMTSFFYHKYGKYKYVDMFFSILLIIYSFYHMDNYVSYIFMISGIVCYIIGLLCSYYICNDIGILFHNLLHILCAVHIISEFIHEI